MNSRERGPGKIRRAKDRQEAVQKESFGEKAESLLSAYAWSREEETFLRILCDKLLPFSEIKLLTWDQIVPDRNALRVKGREYYLSPETGASVTSFVGELLEDGKFPTREELFSSGTMLFSPETARELRVALSRNE